MDKELKEIKCVVWDLDNTIWEGTFLEDSEVTLKPEIESIIKELDSRGILNSIASKNNFEGARSKLEEFNILEYFIYPEINWNAKSVSVRNICSNLNIGMDTILFIDDQEFELDEVKIELEDVSCLNASEYLSLLDMPRLKPCFITEDSKRRRLMYMEDIKRKEDEKKYQGPSDKFLSTLQMKFSICEAKENDLKRAEELTVRTNQLNSTGITYSFDELKNFLSDETHKLFICELTDKYGSYGKIGLALVEISKCWHLKLMLISCRVISRGIGTVFLSFIMNKAKNYGNKLVADFKKTDTNRQMYICYKFANFREIFSDNSGFTQFENDLSYIQDYPNFIEVITP